MPQPPRRPGTPENRPQRRPRVAGIRRPGRRPDDAPDNGRPDEAPDNQAPAQDAPTRDADRTFPADPTFPADQTFASPASDATAAPVHQDPGTTGNTDDDARVVAPPVIGEPEPETSSPGTSSPGTSSPETSSSGTPTSGRTSSRPRPSGKTRAAGTAPPRDLNRAEQATGASTAVWPDTEPDTEPEPEAGSAEDTGSARKRSPAMLAAVLTAIALVLAALAIWFRAESTALEGNQAWVDPARTEEVKSAATKAVEGLFSYNYTDTAKTEKLAKDVLAGDNVRKRYNQLFDQVKREAPKQQLVLTSKAARSAVSMLEDDRARVLIFLDQTSTRATSGETVANGAQLSVNMELQDDSWKVTDIDLFNKQPPGAG